MRCLLTFKIKTEMTEKVQSIFYDVGASSDSFYLKTTGSIGERAAVISLLVQ